MKCVHQCHEKLLLVLDGSFYLRDGYILDEII